MAAKKDAAAVEIANAMQLQLKCGGPQKSPTEKKTLQLRKAAAAAKDIKMAFQLKRKGEVLGINEELSTYNHPVFEKDLGPNIIAEANRDGTIYVNEHASEAQKKGAMGEEHKHLDQMGQGLLQYTNDTVTWKKDTKSPSRVYERMNGHLRAMNSPADKFIEGSTQAPWEAAAKQKVN